MHPGRPPAILESAADMLALLEWHPTETEAELLRSRAGWGYRITIASNLYFALLVAHRVPVDPSLARLM